MRTIIPPRLECQRGWSILEATLVISLLALILSYSIQMVGIVNSAAFHVAAEHRVNRADFALLGYTITNGHFPLPQETRPSATGSQYVEGWFPVVSLGLDSKSRIRYEVDKSLLASVNKLYKVDPTALMAPGLFERTNSNSIDFCLALVERARANKKGGDEEFFAYQLTDSGPDANSQAKPESEQIIRVGYLEFAERLACFDRFADITSRFKKAFLFDSLSSIANQEVRLRALLFDESKQSKANLQWRMANWSVGIAILSGDIVLMAIQMKEGPLSITNTSINIAALALIVSGLGVLLKNTRDGLNDADPGIATAAQNLDDAKAKVNRLGELRQVNIDEVNRLLRSGVMP